MPANPFTTLSTDVAAAATDPAGGAALGEVALVTGFVTVAWGALFWLGYRHRQGRRTPLGLAADLAARISGLPRWAALPLAVVAVSLAGVYAGFMWDAALHIDRGRDAGPLANPAHYVMLLGIYGIFASGYLAMVLPRPGDALGPSAVRISATWRAPLGGVLIALAGGFAFLGFPLDDLWHRLFGQDVTLWGPTHLIMLGGAVLSLIGVAVLVQDAIRLAPGWQVLLIGPVARILVVGALLVGISAFLTEFDYGIPQFSLVFQPLVVALAAGIALVAARLWVGPGAALAAVGVYLAGRLAVAVVVGPILGQTTPAMPLFLGEAACVELAALVFARVTARSQAAGDGPLGMDGAAAVRHRPLTFGATAGLLIGTAGFAAEWPWTHAVMPIHWTSALLPEGLITATAAGLAGGLLGALLGSALRGELPRPTTARATAFAALAAIALLVANGLVERRPDGITATVTLRQTQPGEATATVRFHPQDVAEGATWVRAIAWQGGGRVGFPLERAREGVYRTPGPLPIRGDWKTGVRILNGRMLLGLPIYAPEDRAIPAAEIPAEPRFTRAMRPDRELLQRERKAGVPAWTWTVASLSVLALFLTFLSVLAAGVARFAARAVQRVPA